MADEKTGADGIRQYLTGASSDGGAQTDPDLSLGKYRSSTEIVHVTAVRTSALANIDLDFVAEANGEGAGALIATGADTVTWAPPGGTVGPATTILNGETKIVVGGAGAPWKYVRISRTSATALTGSETTTLTRKDNALFDDVTDAERAAGASHFRCVCMKNEGTKDALVVAAMVNVLGTQQVTDVGQLGASGAGTITTAGSFADWPAIGFAMIKDSGGAEQECFYYSSRTATALTVPAAGRGLALGAEIAASAGAADDTVDAIPGIQIGYDAPDAQPAGKFVDNTGGADTVPPAGISLSTPIVVADEIAIGTVATGEIEALWIKRLTIVGAESQADVPISYRFNADVA